MQNPSWYVLHVYTGRELDVRDKLTEMGITALAPVGTLLERRDGVWITTERVMLPGYVFVQADLAPRLYYSIRGTPGVIKFLGMSSGVPTTVLPKEMEAWLILGNMGRPLEIAEGVRDDVGVTRITKGPLAKLSHLITAVDTRQRKATLELYIHGTTYIITIGIKVKKSSKSQAADEESPRESDGEQSGEKSGSE